MTARWTDADLIRRGLTVSGSRATARRQVEPQRTGGRTRSKPGTMNATEARYAQQLELERIAGAIQQWEFEGLNLRLAPRTYYRPDFTVWRDGRLEIHETKGHWEDDARAKLKIAADKYPLIVFRVLRWHQADKRAARGVFVEVETFNVDASHPSPAPIAPAPAERDPRP